MRCDQKQKTGERHVHPQTEIEEGNHNSGAGRRCRAPGTPKGKVEVSDDTKRWHVQFRYAGEPNSFRPEIDIEELEELQDIVEGGPDWGTLVDIVITYNFHKSAEERGVTAKLS